MLFAVNIIGMEAPASSDDAKIVEILNESEAEFHYRNSFLDAFMDPTRFEISKEGLRFKHYDCPRITYTASWVEANALLTNIVDNVGKILADKRANTIIKYIIDTDPTKLSELNRYEFQLIHSTLHYGNSDIVSGKDSVAVLTKMIGDRNQYRDAFSRKNWKEVRKCAGKKLNQACSFPNLSARIKSFKTVYVAQQYLQRVLKLQEDNKIWKIKEDLPEDAA